MRTWAARLLFIPLIPSTAAFSGSPWPGGWDVVIRPRQGAALAYLPRVLWITLVCSHQGKVIITITVRSIVVGNICRTLTIYQVLGHAFYACL